MKKLMIVALAAVAVFALATSAFADGTPQAGDIGIFFDAAGTQTAKVGVAAFVGFNMYVVTFDVPGGMEAYEFSLTLPAGAIVSAGRTLPAGATDFGAGDDNWIVGTGGICQGATGAFDCVTYGGVLFLAAPANDLTSCLMGATPSSFQNGMPGYLVCQSPGNLQNFGSAYTGCAVVNPTSGVGPTATHESSFGAVKAVYEQ